MKENKCRSRWKMISVVDDDKKEVFNLEVGEKIKEKLRKNVSTLKKSIMLNKQKYIKKKSNLSYKPTLKLTSNTIIFSRMNSPAPPQPPLPLPNINSNENDNKNTKNENPQEISFEFEFDDFSMTDGEQSNYYINSEYEDEQNLYF